MPTWKKVIVSGSNAQLNTLTASAALQVGTNQYITTLPSTTQLSGSFSGSFQGAFNGSIGSATSASFLNVVSASSGTPTNAHYITFVDSDNASALYEQFYTDSGITYTPSSDLLTISGDVAVNGGDITTSATSATVFNTTATTVNAFGAATAITIGDATTATTTIRGGTLVGNTTTQAVFNTTATTVNAFGAATQTNIGAANGTASFAGNVTIAGGLTVNGTTTIVNTTNTVVKDQFILLASGSTGTMDGGIIVGNSATINVGEAFYWENNPGSTGRWAVASAVDATSTTVTPNSYVVTVSGSSNAPTGNPTYGGATNGIGNMYIDTSLTAATDNNIWIFA